MRRKSHDKHDKHDEKVKPVVHDDHDDHDDQAEREVREESADDAASPESNDEAQPVDAPSDDPSPAVDVRAIDDALFRSGIIDLDAGRTCIEGEGPCADAESLAGRIEVLRATRPALFAPLAIDAGAMTARVDGLSPAERQRDAVAHAAHVARETGDRNAVLRFMRLRRSAAS
jgi:hypothetical protein